MSEEKIHAGHLSEALYRHFINYDYLLSNSFVFGGWESDFLANSTSGYWVEVENKISRGDFFRDFDKDKHRLFETSISGKTHFIERYQHGYAGDIIARFTNVYIDDYHGRRTGDNHQNVEWGRKGDEYGFWTCADIRFRKHREEIHAPCTSIRIIDILKKNLPNQFYYCCPTGMLKLQEIPAYAGLLEFNGSSITMVKKAPYLHKRKMDIERELARKFYNLWKYKARHGRKSNQ